MLRIVLVVALLLASAVAEAAAASATAAKRRLALIVGNSAYRHVGPLPNPRRDASAVAGALRAIGFEVRVEEDLGVEPFRRALREFGDAAAEADVALIFYAGHGLEIDRSNYIVPVDARLATDRDLVYEAVPLDLLVGAVDGARGLRLVILDACRDNPFKAMKVRGGTRSVGRGLAAVEPVAGTLVAYAAREGTTAEDGEGEHSPFTEALLDLIPRPGLEVNFLFRLIRDRVLEKTRNQQEPFVYGSLPGREIFLVPRDGSAATGDDTVELAFWNSVKDSANRAEFDAYLGQYPGGKFAALAAARIAALAKPPAGEDPAADMDRAFALGVAAEERRAFKDAAASFTRAADAGHVGAMLRLAALHADAPGLHDRDKARAWLAKAATSGDPVAMFRMAKALEASGKRPDLTQAADLYRRAAEAGNSDAMNNFATLLGSGSGIVRDDRAALGWYRRASDLGNTIAMYNLAAMLDDGRGTKKDAPEAAALILKALRLKDAAVFGAVTGNGRAWSRDFGMVLQRALIRDGLYKGAVDGRLGRPTTDALAAAMK